MVGRKVETDVVRWRTATAEVLQHETISGRRKQKKMKKILASIAVLAFVAAAQAELLATWGFGDGTANAASLSANSFASNAGQVTFSELSRVNGLGTATTKASSFTANGWTKSGTEFSTGEAGLGFTVDVNTGYEIANSVIAVGNLSGGNSGPASFQWKMDGTAVGAAWNSTSAAGSAQSTEATKFTVGAGDHEFLLVGSDTGNNGNATGATGRSDFRTSITFDGDIQAATSVPEPATMSLLGLGALAMVIRRKLRK